MRGKIVNDTKEKMQETFKKLHLLGYETETYLVGLSQFISKEINTVKHESLPEENQFFFSDTEESAKPLPNGMILFSERPRYWHYSFSSDVVLEDGVQVRKWDVNSRDNALQRWVFDVDAYKLSYSDYGHYCRPMTDEVFVELIDAYFEKVSNMVEDVNKMSQFVALLINTDYADSSFMAEVAASYTSERIEKFIEAVEKCKQLSLPVTDYREVFNFSQTM